MKATVTQLLPNRMRNKSPLMLLMLLMLLMFNPHCLLILLNSGLDMKEEFFCLKNTKYFCFLIHVCLISFICDLDQFIQTFKLDFD